MRKVFDIVLGLLIFLTATAYVSGRTFDDVQGQIFRVGVCVLFLLAMNLQPLRYVTNKWFNACIALCLATTVLLPEQVKQVAISQFVNVFLGGILFYLITNYLENKRVILNALCGVVGVMAIMAILQCTGNDPICLNDAGQKNTSFVGLFCYKYAFGTYMGIVAPLLLWCKRRTFGVLAIILTICSMSWIAIGACLLGCVVPLWGFNKRLAIAGVGLAIIGAVIVYFGVLKVPTYYDCKPVIGYNADGTPILGSKMILHPNSLAYKIKSRYDLQRKFLPVLASKPIQGHGLGMFKIIGPQLVNSSTGNYGTMTDAWCDYLEQFVNLGAGIIILLFFLFRDVLRRFWKNKRGIVVFASLIGIPIGMMFHSLLSHYSLGVLFITIFALFEVEQCVPQYSVNVI